MTTLDASFLRAIVILTAFRPERSLRCQAALIYLALAGTEFTGAELPGEVTEGSKHAAGAACGALVSMDLIRVVRRVASPNENAKGRKVNVYLMQDGKASTCRAWLTANGFKLPENRQLELIAA